MSLRDDFSQNQRPKTFSEKVAIFPRRRRTWQTLQNRKNLIMGFLSKRQPEEFETSPHQLRPQYESVRQFQSKSKTKSFQQKITFFPRRVPVENVKTLKA